MPQIAQQDYIKIDLGDLALEEVESIANSFWDTFKKLYEAGTIMDTLLICNDGSIGRFLSVHAILGKMDSITIASEGEVLVIQKPS